MHEFTSALTGGRRESLEDFPMDAYEKRDLHDALWRSHGGFDLVLAPVIFALLGLWLDTAIGTRRRPANRCNTYRPCPRTGVAGRPEFSWPLITPAAAKNRRWQRSTSR